MTVLHSGTTKKYSDNWDSIFGSGKGKKKKTAKKASAKKKGSTRKKASPKKRAATKPAKSPAKQRATRKGAAQRSLF